MFASGTSIVPAAPVERRSVLSLPPLSVVIALLLLALTPRAVAAATSPIELQPERRASRIVITDGAGRRGTAELIDLQPGIGVWHLLRLFWDAAPGQPASVASFHLENPAYRQRLVALDSTYPLGVVLTEAGRQDQCPLWRHGGELDRAPQDGLIYAPLCQGRLFLRLPTRGHKTSREWVSDFLRDRVPGGEQLTSFVKETVYQDSFLLTPELYAVAELPPRPRPSGAPPPALVEERFRDSLLVPLDLGLRLLNDEPQGRLLVGRWYPLEAGDGLFLSVIQPGLVAGEVVKRQLDRTGPLDAIEAKALSYLVAFDLSSFELGFAVGTDHPRVGWSERAPEAAKDPALAGPDGFDSVAPLVRTGMLRPDQRRRVAATFTGGFKRSHGAFRAGELALRNRGSHYGFVENGVVLSSLQPGLSTLAIFADGSVWLGTWQGETTSGEAIWHARQNGVPLLEYDPASASSRPGALVRSWAAGNWSGSQNKELRTLRAGACLVEEGETRYLLYGYFSSVTPAAMARVFAAYRCRDAMLLDMNALEHTYLAVYRPETPEAAVEHLIRGMEVLDQSFDGIVVPRFVAYPDNRDFFYLLRRER